MQQEKKQQAQEVFIRPLEQEETEIFIYPEIFPEQELDKQLQEELQNASELDPVLDAWYIEDSDRSSDTVEIANDAASVSSEEEEEEEFFRCRGLLEDKTYSSVVDALRDAAVVHDFCFERELQEANLDIYGRIASVNLLRKLVYMERLTVKETLKRWRDYVHNLGQGSVCLDTRLLQSYFRDDPLLHFAADYFMEDEWVD
ncbi:hypothetical protein Gasu2_49320 [Galdieria sulphuraria]|uniref:Uncharacterized protein n=1 Tax=Galdieria sulphuraria TaxID=130081 RepID=M2X2S6_GALSU|nr:uncharacterized protein Gasu_19320 [Galdieria sulphuraria]EME30685.1 hypothetical protein Gasu_19320 [Galdieria sulphuraria]GJD10758.1 hypothetical protein Gasu2_49320 [Galdieria sulphuraria]|eukprot:XP_005707205.1 hypothetical protein Gasu_19320 [Galdieria sulphuraria]